MALFVSCKLLEKSNKKETNITKIQKCNPWVLKLENNNGKKIWAHHTRQKLKKSRYQKLPFFKLEL